MKMKLVKVACCIALLSCLTTPAVALPGAKDIELGMTKQQVKSRYPSLVDRFLMSVVHYGEETCHEEGCGSPRSHSFGFDDKGALGYISIFPIDPVVSARSVDAQGTSLAAELVQKYGAPQRAVRDSRDDDKVHYHWRVGATRIKMSVNGLKGGETTDYTVQYSISDLKDS